MLPLRAVMVTSSRLPAALRLPRARAAGAPALPVRVKIMALMRPWSPRAALPVVLIVPTERAWITASVRLIAVKEVRLPAAWILQSFHVPRLSAAMLPSRPALLVEAPAGVPRYHP